MGWDGHVFRSTVIWIWFKLPFCLFGHTKPDMSVIYEKAKFVSFIYMQPQKVKFRPVQINMKVEYLYEISI